MIIYWTKIYILQRKTTKFYNDASNKIGVAINAEKTKHLFKSGEHYAGQSRNVKLDNKSS